MRQRQNARSSAWRKALAPVSVLTLASLGLAVLLSETVLHDFNLRTQDGLMRTRIAVRGGVGNKEITLLAMDESTREHLGRFGSGFWATRVPYFRQLRMFEEYFRPSVLAYDVAFVRSRSIAHTTSSEPASRGELDLELMGRLRAALSATLDSGHRSVPFATLGDLAELEVTQGTLHFAKRLSSLYRSDAFPILLAYNFRGGWTAPQQAVPAWSRKDIVGDDPGGDVAQGDRVSYLLDVRIPEGSIRFLSDKAASNYSYATNATTPDRKFIGSTFMGAINVPRDQDGVVRSIPLVIGFEFVNPVTGATRRAFVPSLALLACMIHLGIDVPLEPGDSSPIDVEMGRRIRLRPPGREEIRIPIDTLGRMRLNFDSTLDDFQHISFWKTAPDYELTPETTLDRRAATIKPLINRRLVFVGMVATGTVDIGPTSLSAHTPFVTVHLTAANNILRNSFARQFGSIEQSILYAALALFFWGLCILVRSPMLAPITLLIIVAYVAVAYQGLVHANLLLPLAGPIAFLLAGSFSMLSYWFLVEERGRRKVRGMFSTMVSPLVLEYLEDNPESFSLEGRIVNATVFFSDVVNFTSISEGLAPDELTRLLNDYLTPVTRHILSQNAYLNKYVGDLVMAVWGIPYPQDDHAVNACRAALEQQQIVRAHRDEWQRRYGALIAVRMGLNSGRMTAGNMGSLERAEYTVIGDAVNLASRLEPINRDYGTEIIIGAATREQLGDALIVRQLDKIVVLGKQEAVDIYELVAAPGDVRDDRIECINYYEAALALYRERRWKEAVEQWEKSLSILPDHACGVMIARARSFMEAPPGDGWQGEYVRAAKR